MEKHYTCPNCNGQLKVGEYVILMAKNKSKEKGIILLHPEIGNYTSLKHPSFTYQPNESLELFCPLCQKSLASDFDHNLSHLILSENGKQYDIYFSRIAGEQSTYIIDGEKVTATGEHADRYTYFKMSDKFKQYLHL